VTVSNVASSHAGHPGCPCDGAQQIGLLLEASLTKNKEKEASLKVLHDCVSLSSIRFSLFLSFILTIVADPESGAFLAPGSGICDPE
jgi:hypothetical protein